MMDSSAVRNGQDPAMSSQDDFQQFLDMGINNLGDALHFDFQDFNQQQGQDAQMMHHDGGDRMDIGMDNNGGMGQDTTMQEHIPSHPSIQGAPISHAHDSTERLSELDAQIQYLQHQRQQQQRWHLQEQQRNFYAQNRMIPPTPNSTEMHGAAAQFYPTSGSQSRGMFDRYQVNAKEQDMAFTPLVSPAVTPLDPHFNIPEYTVPGAYFSPLSSPALHAQSEHSSAYDQRHSGTTNSPVDMNLDSHSAPASSVIPSRKTSRKVPPKPKATRSVRQSPIVKPKRSKKSSATAISSQALGNIIEPPNSKQNQPNEVCSAASTEESENGSISPEHLSEMAPPPVPPPGSAGRSPYVQAQKKNARTQRLPLESPATPASLMRLTQSPQVNETHLNHSNMDVDEGMDGFALPEPATNTRPQLARIETQSDGQTTPTLNSTGAKTPGFQPLPSPSVSRPRTSVSASQSPQIDAMNGSNGTNGTRKNPSIAPRGSKKRSSSSVIASPALLPRISPSIKPLLPGGGRVSEDTASLLLASKSNYQNILEGTHLPGVSYPTELSTNLTSKRTSHKIAEQGRRNRINSALQEIATLLPRGAGKDSSGEKSGSGEGADGNDNGNRNINGKAAAQSANSKASTVEQAIEYIKQLQKDLAEANKRAEKAEKELEAKA